DHGIARFLAGQTGKALEDFTAAETLDPAYPDAFRNHAALLESQGRRREAAALSARANALAARTPP
ncbi:MAG TPA: hypothetical protein VN915_14285, partial [Elusimicrobiota bacterium]|nr:hypothetical protein [Elusimicrobiota bacterium]